MDYYKLLGIEEDASKEEIKAAYEKQVSKYREEIKDEKRAKLFIKAFDDAYEALMKIEVDGSEINGLGIGQSQVRSIRDINRNETVVMDSQEIQKEYEIQRRGSARVDSSENKYKRKNSSSKSTQKTSNQKKNTSTNRQRENQNQDKRNEKVKKQKVFKEKENSTVSTVINILLLPLKILALPIIAILSVIIFVCKIINIVSWIASKVIIVGAIGGGAIYLYEVHFGRQVMNNKLIVVLAIAIIASYFLPHILRFILKIFGSLNDVLKNFVF